MTEDQSPTCPLLNRGGSLVTGQQVIISRLATLVSLLTLFIVCVPLYLWLSDASILLSDLSTERGRRAGLSCSLFPCRQTLLQRRELVAWIAPPASINSLSIYYSPTGWSSWLKLIVKPWPRWFNRLWRVLTMTNSLTTIIHHKTFPALQ